MATVRRIRIKASGDETWARPEAAARMVAAGEAEYLDQPAGVLETASIQPPENAALRVGRAPARGRKR